MKLPDRMIYGCAWKKDSTTRLVVLAVRAGFRSIDVAAQLKHYNQPGVGHALSILSRNHGISRNDLFLQTKFTSLGGQDTNGPLPYDPNATLVEQVRQSFQTSLKELQTEYIDSLLLHSPERTVEKTVEALLALKPFLDSGELRSIGISNIYELRALRAVNDALKEHDLRIRFVQNRFYAATGYDRALRKYCIDNDIVYQSFWTLTANPEVLSSAVVKAIAKRLNITREQVFYQFCIQQGITPLNGTTNEERMKPGVAVLRGQVGEITPDEVESIDKLLH